MFELLPLALLFLSGICCTAFNMFKVGKYGAIVSSFLFVVALFFEHKIIKFNWFFISDFAIDFSFNFSETSVLICAIISSILVCLYMARSISFFDNSIERKFGILNIFIFFMCLAILSDNIFQFYIGVESLGLISAILVGMEKNAEKEATKVFLFNKFASVIFLVSISILVLITKSFDISKISEICLTNSAIGLFFPACLLLISCFCKGAQMPFSYWLLDAVKANTFASILIHAGTIVAVGIIFISKFYFIFECFPILKKTMIAVGICTAFWMACCALANDNIKKIIACLTASSAGIMFVSCGVGGYSLAILYFICHAFFKSMLFLSFAYLMSAMSGEKSLSKLGGIASLAPKVTDIIWVSFLCAAGFPFLSGFFAKISFIGTVDLSEMGFLSISSISINLLSIAAMFRMLMKALYGDSKSDELTLSRSSKSNLYDIKSFWFLTCISIFGSFSIWSIFEWGDLHFGYAGIVYVRNAVDYFFENVSSISQIGLSIFIVLKFEKFSKLAGKNIDIGIAISLFRKNEIYEYFCNLLKNIVMCFTKLLDSMYRKIAHIINFWSFKLFYCVGKILLNLHRKVLSSQIIWILFGIAVVIILTLLGVV